MNRPAPRSIDQYLDQLRDALRGEDPALVQDALYDAEEYLRAEVAAHAGKSEPDVLEIISSTYGAPDEVADAYRTTERTVNAALKRPAPPPRRTVLGRFFGVFVDARAWSALFFMVLALATGIFYFTVAVTGLSLSVGLAVLIVGVPFFLLFIGLSRVLSLVEGRIVEGLLGVRMPRRPMRAAKDVPFTTRILDMLRDVRTWTTLLYFVLMLPLGIVYFVIATVGLAVGTVLTAGAVVLTLQALGMPSVQEVTVAWWDGPMPYAFAPLLLIGGVLVYTSLLHVARVVGYVHGTIAKSLLVSGSRD